MTRSRPRPALVKHGLISRVASSFADVSPGPLATVDDVCILVAAIVCGGPILQVDPTVADETKERTETACEALDLQVQPGPRPPTTQILDATRNSAPMVRNVGAQGSGALAPVALSRDPGDQRVVDLVAKHRRLVGRLHESLAAPEDASPADLRDLAAWLCAEPQEKAFGNKLLAGLCSHDADAGPHDRLLHHYLNGFDAAESGQCTYSYTNSYIRRFRDAYLPVIAQETRSVHYTSGEGNALNTHVRIIDSILREVQGRPTADDHPADDDRMATHAFAWASHKVILDGGWSPERPLSLLEAARKAHGGDATKAMTRAIEVAETGEGRAELVRELRALPERYDRHAVRAFDSIVFGAVFTALGPTITGLVVGSPSELWPLPAISSAGLGGALGAAVPHVLSSFRKSDLAAATFMRNSLKESTLQAIESELAGLRLAPPI